MLSGTHPSRCLYRLCGVVCHGGSLAGGHYSSYVLHDSYKSRHGEDGGDPSRAVPGLQWYYHNDTRFRLATEAEVLKRQAYMVCFAREDTFLPPPPPTARGDSPSGHEPAPGVLDALGDEALQLQATCLQSALDGAGDGRDVVAGELPVATSRAEHKGDESAPKESKADTEGKGDESAPGESKADTESKGDSRMRRSRMPSAMSATGDDDINDTKRDDQVSQLLPEVQGVASRRDHGNG